MSVAANEGTDADKQKEEVSSIPYKQEKPVATNMGASITALIIFLLLAGGVVLYMKKFNIGKLLKVEGERKIDLVETRRLSTRTVAFLVKINGTEVLVVQSGDSIHSVKLDSDEV
jgi:flagellar biogenesis protein FliO